MFCWPSWARLMMALSYACNARAAFSCGCSKTTAFDICTTTPGIDYRTVYRRGQPARGSRTTPCLLCARFYRRTFSARTAARRAPRPTYGYGPSFSIVRGAAPNTRPAFFHIGSATAHRRNASASGGRDMSGFATTSCSIGIVWKDGYPVGALVMMSGNAVTPPTSTIRMSLVALAICPGVRVYYGAHCGNRRCMDIHRKQNSSLEPMISIRWDTHMKVLGLGLTGAVDGGGVLRQIDWLRSRGGTALYCSMSPQEKYPTELQFFDPNLCTCLHFDKPPTGWKDQQEVNTNGVCPRHKNPPGSPTAFCYTARMSEWQNKASIAPCYRGHSMSEWCATVCGTSPECVVMSYEKGSRWAAARSAVAPKTKRKDMGSVRHGPAG
jgi:hypothetical protein